MKQYRYGMNEYILRSESKIIYMHAYIQMFKVEDES